MKRLLSTRFGFFLLAAVVCWALLLVIDREFRWVALAAGCLYFVLSVLFWADDYSRAQTPRRQDPPRR